MSAEEIAKTYRTLGQADLRILLGTELGMTSREYVPVSRIVRYANLLEEEVVKHLPDLVERRVLSSASKRELGYSGFRLTFLGYDCLAVNVLVKRGIVEALGRPLGLGKESDVYDARARRGSSIALKFHRLGRVSFRQTRRARGYVADRAHTSWLYQARMAATREFAAMKRAHRVGVPVPRPIGHNRHLVAMTLFKGTELNRTTLDNPLSKLRSILLAMKRLFRDARVVHGDLSEYNVLISESGRFAFIDWPQSVNADDPRANSLLERDVSNMLRFFAKKYRASVPFEDALDFVRSKKRTLI